MDLTVGILMDELSILHPIKQKVLSLKTSFEQICYYDNQDLQPNPSFLYLAASTALSINLSRNCPKHLLILGSEAPLSCLEYADTVIHISDKVPLDKLFQFVMNIFVSYEKWNQSMLLAIINHKSVGEFLEVAAQKLTNPIAFSDNNLTLIAKVGQFTKPYTGTVWENMINLGYIKTDFFTIKEQLELSAMISNTGTPYVYHPCIDKEHSYVTTHIWIGEKLYGNLGLVDINSPFSEGQLSIIEHITKSLKLYIQDNDAYMRISENEVSFINSLLKGITLDEKIITYHLARLKWNIHDNFYLLSFACPVPLDSPIQSLSYIKRIGNHFPESLITIYENSIVLIIRNQDFSIKNHTKKQNLEQFLITNEMKCGVSTCFTDFMKLKIYFTQSSFALEYCNNQTEVVLQHYEGCHKEHIMQLLRNATDLRCFCHPQILAMWDSQDENQHELIHCLYHFLLNGRNIALTSEVLYIHRNTLIYRLNKISKILGTDLKSLSSEQLFYLLFSCMLVEHL